VGESMSYNISDLIKVRKVSSEICAFCGGLIGLYNNRKTVKAVNVPKGEVFYFCCKKHKKDWFAGKKPKAKEERPVKPKRLTKETVSFSVGTTKLEKLLKNVDGKERRFLADVMREAVDEYITNHAL
jgi:hypothetical protein